MVGYEGTEKNLKALGFPNVDKKHLLLRTKSSDKQERRDIVAKDYKVAMLLGDNLNDFLSVFAKKSVADRFAKPIKSRICGARSLLYFRIHCMANGRGLFISSTGVPAQLKKT